MKRTIPIVLIGAAALVAIGMFLSQRDPSTRFTADREAWDAYVAGDAALQSFRWSEAEELLQRAIALDPELVMAQTALAELYGRMGMSEAAQSQYAVADSLVALDDDPFARLLVQVRLSNSKLSEQSEAQDSLLAAAHEIAGDHILVLVTEANRATYREDMAEAERIWNRVLELNPNYAAAYNFLGYLYLAQGRYDEAEAAMRRYAFVAPDLANPHDSLGEVLMNIGRYEEAEVEFRTALAKQPDFFHSLMNIGRIYMLRGQVDKANELLDRVAEEVVGTNWAHEVEVRRLRALYEHRVFDDLDQYALRYAAKYPERPIAAHVRLWRLIALGDENQALALLDSLNADYQQQDWFQSDPERRQQVNDEQLRYRGLLTESLGEHAAAAQAFRQVVASRDELPPHMTIFDRVHLAYNLGTIGETEAARHQIRTVLAVNPRLPEAVLVAALIEASAGEVGEAHRYLDTLERMLERSDPDFPTLLDARSLREQLPARGQI